MRFLSLTVAAYLSLCIDESKASSVKDQIEGAPQDELGDDGARQDELGDDWAGQDELGDDGAGQDEAGDAKQQIARDMMRMSLKASNRERRIAVDGPPCKMVKRGYRIVTDAVDELIAAGKEINPDGNFPADSAEFGDQLVERIQSQSQFGSIQPILRYMYRLAQSNRPYNRALIDLIVQIGSVLRVDSVPLGPETLERLFVTVHGTHGAVSCIIYTLVDLWEPLGNPPLDVGVSLMAYYEYMADMHPESNIIHYINTADKRLRFIRSLSEEQGRLFLKLEHGRALLEVNGDKRLPLQNMYTMYGWLINVYGARFTEGVDNIDNLQGELDRDPVLREKYDAYLDEE